MATEITYALGAGQPEARRAEFLVLFLHEGEKKVQGAVRRVDARIGGRLQRGLDRGDLCGKLDEVTAFDLDGKELPARRLLLLGLGPKADADAESLRRAGAQLGNRLAGKSLDASVAVEDLPAATLGVARAVQSLVEGIGLAAYSFDRFRDSSRKQKSRVFLLGGREKDAAARREGLAWAEVAVKASATGRDIGNLPGNHGQPAKIAAAARGMARRRGLKSTILGRAQMERLGMGSLLSVALGSPHEPKLIVLEHRPRRKGPLKTLCLVGKGLTFDSGGISIKPADGMDKMRHDKCGGAAVIGALEAAAALDIPLNVVGIVPSSENMPGGDANKPGDVVRAANGKTIEILNTDAEGRLILADALHYAQRFEPDWIVDLATLTGACMVALGSHCCGLMGNDDDLAARLERAGRASFERCWRLPLWREHQEEMKGSTTDLKNLGGRFGGAITAAAFLQEFVGGRRWAHLDIAGVAWDDPARPYNRGKGATGFGVRLLIELMRDLAERGA